MRGDLVFRVYGQHAGREEDSYFGTYRTREEANSRIAELSSKQMHSSNWASRYHNRGFVVRTIEVDTDFAAPPRPKARDRFYIETKLIDPPDTGNSTLVRVFERRVEGKDQPMCEYVRNHSMYSTFEPFRQRGQDYALISRDYTRAAVLDLKTGRVIAEEQATPNGAGFCPVGFYVPDWWDMHDGSLIPGSAYWGADCEWPIGDFGFVWGCIWGDDSSWKVQHLDLSRIEEGILARDERFGYVELACSGHPSPCFSPDPPPSSGSKPPDFIALSRRNGKTRVTFAVEMDFELESGKCAAWQRTGTPFD